MKTELKFDGNKIIEAALALKYPATIYESAEYQCVLVHVNPLVWGRLLEAIEGEK